MEAAGYEVVSVDVLPDDRGMLGSRMAEIADRGLAELILTTGGTIISFTAGPLRSSLSPLYPLSLEVITATLFITQPPI